ncbi:SDR family oxidoreductase [Oscillatoria sp. FACHB-1406]|uniref:SDR family NAD(P)-dependent oxidoreductase n=1 Tax=Oscillatoria sp. FACHB-1406 TaxID=2692846 RepID=UPI00168910C6|nr:SDR family oxidoreductase [Oscillatoria sp. FACHB-1406]MBD2578880.1 SDR family oxidoreductase [Oscillatoria sp. FACHB-1406]
MKFNFKTRIKAALKSFVNPNPAPKTLIQKQVVECSDFLEKKLLSHKNVLITGAGRNIGRSIALEMAKQGANIFFTDLSSERCIELERELKAYPIQSQGWSSDISKQDDIENLLKVLEERDIKIDILVNNVGINLGRKPVLEISAEEWQQTFNANVFGPLDLTRKIVRITIERKIQGSIIFVTSIHQWQLGLWAHYSSSKAALGMIIKELAVELAPRGIRVNGIAPGAIAEDEKGNPFVHDYTLLHRTTINPEYIGRAAVYLASDYFSMFTTGTILNIDAGLSLYNYRISQHFPQ